MASLIPGYEYDIFISYRQKDNKHDGWVTEFVDNLKGELESTFKEEISVYFDINPHDGLLETHDVDASLKDKLKCLIFIPIISRTYCDPKSFAWEHEFKAFIEQASQDQFGLKVKLPNGNVANRILQIQIHEITANDKAHIEKELGGVLRAIEFIYKEPGVNKPLTANDDEKLNLNKTKYRIQINKVANAIDEIISGLKAEPTITEKEKTPTAKEPVKNGKKEEKKEQKEKPAKLDKRKLLSGVAILAILIIAAVFAYPKIFKHDTLEKLRSSGERISVAVMPFKNMTNDTSLNYMQEVIQENLITYLSNYLEELKIRQTESVNTLLQSKGFTNYASITPSIATTISRNLDANVFIYGSIQMAGHELRIDAKLIDTKTEEVLKSFEIDGPYKEEVIFETMDSLRKKVTEFLVISKLKKGLSPDFQIYDYTNSLEAYKYFISGNNAVMKGDPHTAVEMFLKAIAIDSNFIVATLFLSANYENQGLYEDAKKWCLKIYKKKDQLSRRNEIMLNWIYATLFETPQEEIKYLKQDLEFDDKVPVLRYLLGTTYIGLNEFDKAIPELEKSLDLYEKWDTKPGFANYSSLGYAYHKTGQYKKEKKLYKKEERDFPDNASLFYRQAILALTEGDSAAANRYIEKFISIGKDNSWNEAGITTNLAMIYNEAGVLDKAEKYYRQVLSANADKPVRLNNLGWFLIDKDRNLDEGLELVDKALKIDPENYNYLDTKGWGLYKKEKYKEALIFLQKADSLKPVYDHDLFIHLEAAKQAVANQKKN